MQQGQPQFVQPRVNPQGQPIRQQRQPSPFRQGFNPSAQPFIPVAEAQPNAVPNAPEDKVPKSNGGQGMKSSAPDGHTCFRCKQPEHVCQRFKELCEEYGEAFSKHNEDISRTKLVKMDIDTGDSPPISSRPYTLPLRHYELVQREIESLEWAGVIKKKYV